MTSPDCLLWLRIAQSPITRLLLGARLRFLAVIHGLLFPGLSSFRFEDAESHA